MADFHHKVGDLLPAIRTVLTDAEDQPIVFTGSEDVYFIARDFQMMPWALGNIIAEGDADWIDPSGGIVEYKPVDGDTAERGGFVIQWIVTVSPGEEMTFPNFGYDYWAVTEREPAVGS